MFSKIRALGRVNNLELGLDAFNECFLKHEQLKGRSFYFVELYRKKQQAVISPYFPHKIGFAKMTIIF